MEPAMDKRRMNRIFRENGRTLIVALDHIGYMKAALPDLRQPEQIVAECVAGGADGFLLNYGTAQRVGRALGDAALIMTITTNLDPAATTGVEQALRLGADGVKVLVYPFESNPEPSMLTLARLAAECDAWGMPLLAETIPGGWGGGPDMRTAAMVGAGARVAAAAGADFVKTFMVDGPGEFAEVVAEAWAPVVILGGAAADDEKSLLEGIRASLDQGGAGVAIGRNIFAHPRPRQMVAAIAALLHEDRTVEEALELIAR
jgi:DhnA family fructose-bisphosphate aldolase class Ia